MKMVYISFNADINNHTAQVLLDVTFNQINNGADHIYYLFSTNGGLVSAGIGLYNTLKGLSVETTMHNVSSVDSVGNAIFLAGKNRICCPQSSFLFHGVTINYPNAVSLEEKHLSEKLGVIKSDQQKMSGVIAGETTLKSAEIEDFFLKSQTIDANFALAHKIVHKISPVQMVQGAPRYQIVFNG